tara:strand:+ start:81 stop:1187 length:1107 start_codon:yes stop_codon:yes gene_type:complete
VNAQQLLPINDGTLSLAPMNAEDVLDHYPGISRVKPETYFGESPRSAAMRLGLNTPNDLGQWYSRVYSAYTHYWGDTTGRLHCWEPQSRTTITGKEALMSSLVCDVVPEPYNDGHPPTDVHGIHLGFEIPPLELYRRCNALPHIDAPLHVASVCPSGVMPLFYQIDIGAAPIRQQRAHGLADRADAEGRAWISANEYNRLNVQMTSVNAVGYSRAAKPVELQTRYPFKNWESLSLSVAAAHIGRLSGVTGAWCGRTNLRGLMVCGAIRAMLADRVTPLLDLLPAKTRIHFGLGRVYFAVDSSVLTEALATARSQRLLPLCAVNGIAPPQSDASGDDSTFDLLFDVLLQGQYESLHEIDERALRKGGIL